MKRLLLLLFLIILNLPVIAQDTPVPQPVSVIEGDFSRVLLYFDSVQQGRAALLQVDGNISAVSGTIFGRNLNFFTIPQQPGQFAFVVASMEQATNTYELQVRIVNDTGLEQLYQILVNVVSGGFQTQDVLLFGEKSELVNEEIEINELNRIFEVAAPSDEPPYWIDSGFAAPLQGELSSPFGLDRTFNGFLRTRHTGWDVNVGTGMPVFASGSGEVVFAGQLPIRGNYVLIHHGAGVYSGYAHFSVLHVTQGQAVTAGQLIGQVGTSGRSSSAHAHFEFIVNGEWVDPVDFIQMSVPR